ncbi:SOS response-associated peptidase [Glycomyces xiaoerkulensis]|uniref:SOS response-associated peptidase n=1 Tax=Glycomyces xiaoerkulensis TaxID=2038139 RepID=UPI000C267F8F|nr:SOS response-associated peptidase [Glycomyces xiaoerkulensis]
MCGRYANSKSGGDMAALFDADDLVAGAWAPKWNIAPTSAAPVVRRSESRAARVVEEARWGLVPPWASDPGIGVRMFNARIETVATSKAYRRPFAARRALVPADGWYEWRKLPGGGKQPYFFTRPGGVVFAGLWESWNRGEARLLSFTVLTCPAMGEALEAVHDRMPYVLPPERFSAWLGEEDADEGELLAGPDPALPEHLEVRRVGRAVGRTGNEGPELVRPVDAGEGPNALPGV